MRRAATWATFEAEAPERAAAVPGRFDSAALASEADLRAPPGRR
ncbi:MAG: hypothetical protein ACRD2W_03570 [Acidimicrobiales bacterium]